jgi:GT2 family glycosyltransferase
MTPTAIVVVNFNTREHLRACLATLEGQRAARVVVVDNASPDASADMVHEEHPAVELLTNRHNEGYGAAANRGIRACAEPYVLVLNADTRLEADAVRALADFLDAHPRAAAVGPRLVREDGTLQPSALPFPRPVTLRPLVRHVPLIREWYLPTWSHSRPRRVPYVLGAALCLRRSAFDEVGGFDSGFFLFYEEVDLCQRLRLAGWEIHFAPVTTVVHTGGASTAQDPETTRQERAAAERLFYERWYSGDQKRAVLALSGAVSAARRVRDRIRGAVSRDGKGVDGAAAGAAGRVDGPANAAAVDGPAHAAAVDGPAHAAAVDGRAHPAAGDGRAHPAAGDGRARAAAPGSPHAADGFRATHSPES